MNVSRRRYMGGKGGSIPYQRIEYLKSTGTQYIVTDIVPNQNDFRCAIDARKTTTGSPEMFFGISSSISNLLHILCGSSNFYYRFRGANQAIIASLYRHTYELGNTSKFDEVPIITNGTETLVGNTNPLVIFANSNSSQLLSGLLYSCKAYYGDTLLMDLIPVRVESVGYMYDTVSGQLYGNAGTGNFELGPDVVPIPYQQVEYLESDGTQYIDTGIKASNNVYIKCKLVDYFNQGHLGSWPFGGRNAFQNSAFGLYIDSTSKNVTLSISNLNIACKTYSAHPSTSIIQIGEGFITIGSYMTTYNVGSFTSSYNVVLFGLQNGSTTIQTTAKIGKTYISNGTITRDFVPVRVGQIGYMYDRVSGQLFGSDGTGDLIPGPDVN